MLCYNGRIISGEISGGSCLVVLAHTKWNHSMELFGIFFGCIARAVVAAAGKRFFFDGHIYIGTAFCLFFFFVCLAVGEGAWGFMSCIASGWLW